MRDPLGMATNALATGVWLYALWLVVHLAQPLAVITIPIVCAAFHLVAVAWCSQSITRTLKQ